MKFRFQADMRFDADDAYEAMKLLTYHLGAMMREWDNPEEDIRKIGLDYLGSVKLGPEEDERHGGNVGTPDRTS